MEKVFSKLEGDLSGNFYRHSEMTQAQTQQLIDDHFLFRGKDRMQAASGYHEYWPGCLDSMKSCLVQGR
jgi:creatine kinase